MRFLCLYHFLIASNHPLYSSTHSNPSGAALQLISGALLILTYYQVRLFNSPAKIFPVLRDECRHLFHPHPARQAVTLMSLGIPKSFGAPSR